LTGLRSVARHIGVRRKVIAPLRLRAERSALAWLAAQPGRPGGRILCYHSVGTAQWGVNDVTPQRFRRQLEMAIERGYRFVPAERIACGAGSWNELAVTFDDGLKSVALNAAPILAELGIPWSLFVVSEWAAGRHPFGEGVMLGWRDIERLAGARVGIGSHSVSHADFGYLSPAQAEAELFNSRRAIEQAIGIVPNAFAVPIGGTRNWTADASRIAREVGYDLIYAQAEDRRPAGTIARTFVTRYDGDRQFRAALAGAFDRWEEWV